jgi:aminoglycoside phosphotransferase (APT) family kinase protein
MYAFDLEYDTSEDRRREALVLRLYPGVDALEKSRREFHHLRIVHQNGYPVPKVSLLEDERSPFGKPFLIMERIDGQSLGMLLFHSDNPGKSRFLRLFCELFVRLHRLDWHPLVEPEKRAPFTQPYYFIGRWRDAARDDLKIYELADFLPVMHWLEQRRDKALCVHPSVIHGDFHPFNVLVRADGSAVVIDWSGCRVSDARFDLAWTLMLASAYHGIEWREKILTEYERISESRVEAIEYFEVAACARRLFDISVSMTQGPEKVGMRPEALSMMKREMGAALRVYEFLLERTQIRLDSVEKMLSEV